MSTIAENEWPRQITVLGVGLLGGSVALSLKRARPKIRIHGLARNAAKGKYLMDNGLVDFSMGTVGEACQNSDVVVVASPVDRIAELVVSAAEHSPDHCLITDVGSTKQKIVASVGSIQGFPENSCQHIRSLDLKSGPHATSSLFDGKRVVLTPAENTLPEQLQKAHAFWQLTGGQTCEMTPSEHDTHLAISHMPHLVAALVAKITPTEALPWLAAAGVTSREWQQVTPHSGQPSVAKIEKPLKTN